MIFFSGLISGCSPAADIHLRYDPTLTFGTSIELALTGHFPYLQVPLMPLFGLTLYNFHSPLFRSNPFIIRAMTQRSSRAQGKAPAHQTDMRETTPPPHKGVTLMSTSQIRKTLTNSKHGVYIGHPGLPSASLFHLGGSKGDFLISTQSHDELILRGVFQISRSDCFLSPDGAFQPNNQFRSKFEDVKLSCRLTAPHHDDFQFMGKDFETALKNMRGFEALFQKSDDDTTLSSLQTSGGWGTIKMVHPLFLVNIFFYH